MTVLMVAPNGARKGKADHPALPITTPEIVETARACAEAGADAIHLHVRDDAGRASLDPERYAEAIERVAAAVGDRMAIQASTETFGGFGPEDVEHLLRSLKPRAASVAMRDLAPEPEDAPRARRVFDWAREEGIAIQHILYGPSEVARLERVLPPDAPAALLLVLGRYAADETSDPRELPPFLTALAASSLKERAEWMVCAFGATETRCLAAAAALGGHCRIGFENNLRRADGSVAASNAARAAEMRAALAAIGLPDRGGGAVSRVLGAAPTE